MGFFMVPHENIRQEQRTSPSIYGNQDAALDALFERAGDLRKVLCVTMDLHNPRFRLLVFPPPSSPLMKIIVSAAAASLALILTSPAAPRLQVSTPSIAPESELQVIFDQPVTVPAELGKKVANDLLEITPALPGKLLWKAQHVANFIPDQSPAMGTTYHFALAKDRQHLDGSAIPAGEFAAVASEAFQVKAANTPNRWSSEYSAATASWLLYFNDAVAPDTAAPFIAFISKSGQRAKAKLTPATLARAGNQDTNYPTWAARTKQPAPTGTSPTPPQPPDTPLATALIATPDTPLPPAGEWFLVVQKGCPNQSGTARQPADTPYEIGKVLPFAVESMVPRVSTEHPRHLLIGFTQLLPKPLPADFLANCVVLQPRPANLTAEVDDYSLLLHGDFSATDKYTLTIKPPLASKIGHQLGAPRTATITFERLDPELILPSHDQAQLASGARTYRIQTVNLASLHVRVKQLSGLDAVRAFQGYRNYSGDGPDNRYSEKTAALPYALIAGKTVHEQDLALGNPVDSAKEITLDWNQILPPNLRHSVLFLDVTGTVHPDLHKTGKYTTQAIIQLTDLGLAWKLTAREAFIYAFSCSTGQPLSGVNIELYGEDAAALTLIKTDATGLATVPRQKDARHLRATLGEDTFITAFDNSLNTVGLWHFPVHYSWEKTPEAARRAFLFTDRSLYRPGETVRLKGVIRTLRGNTLEASTPGPARIVVIDPTEKEIFTQPVTVSAAGSFDLTYTLPSEQTGTHLIRLEYPQDLAKAETTEDWAEKEALTNNARFEIPLKVEDFRRNTFEVTQAITPPATAAATVAATIEARYYQGQPVAAGKVVYHTRVSESNPYPDRFRDFQFGNHRVDDWRYWYHYFGCRWDLEGEDSEDDGNRSSGPDISQQQAETMLSADGKTAVSIPLPQAEFPTAHEVVVTSETTDANNQTLTSRSTATVHPAAIYVGVSRVDSLVRAGEPLPLKVVAISPDGQPLTTAAKVTATLTREINSPTKSRTESGATTTSNDSREETVTTAELTIDPAASAKEGVTLTVTPRDTGLHFLTLRGTDPDGHAFATVTRFNVYGTKEYPWLYEDGLRVKLVAEKKSYRPGDTARVLVLSPIEGTALVTVEREKVLRSFMVQLKADSPVIEIPLTAEDAPNACVSILIVKGAQESARKFKQPQLRLGYCELAIENLRDRLAVTLAATGGQGAADDATPPTYRPGDKVTLTGTVTQADGKPAANAEVTVYAEDEGTLAVMGYLTPDPMAFFYSPRNLQVDTGTSFETFISEDPALQYFFNKGFFVGGGGDLSKLADLLRKNFDPCATWAPAVTTDATGRFSHTFKVPDTLTRYRLIAIAHHQAARFGNAAAAIIVNKPLMLEPKTPRFANQADLISPQVLVQNASEFTGTWKITYTAHAATGTPVCRALTTAPETVTLAPGASATLVFPSVLENTGEAVSSWQAIPVSLAGSALTPALIRSLSDAVEARYPVNYPMPLLRQTQFVKLDRPGANQDLLQQLDQALLGGTGELDLEFSTSPLTEAGGAIDYLLAYPHGCVEQTTSSLMPWFAVEPLRNVIPAFAKIAPEKVRDAIQAGANRLLTMQLADGSFAYWPGDTKTAEWANSYAGLGLILASQHGANVPASAIDNLTNYLIGSLRGVAKVEHSYGLDEHARALWVLALAGKPQPAYHNVLKERLTELSPTARCLLALAIGHSKTKADLAAAKQLLASNKPIKVSEDWWMPYDTDDALRLLAWATLDFKAKTTSTILDRLFNDRNPYGHWRNTWANGWSLLAVATYAEQDQTNAKPTNLTLETPDGPRTIRLDAKQPTAACSFPLGAGLKLALANDNKAFVRLRLAAKPAITPIQPVATNGLSIDRFYEKVNADGTTATLTEPAVGDLIRVSLRVTLPTDNSRYLVVEDLLPAIFETVNSDFKSQRAAAAVATTQDSWEVSHTELRSDRAVFYLDQVGRRGTYTLTYLARCTLAGQTTAPPAKVESMYDPTQFALSPSRIFKSR